MRRIDKYALTGQVVAVTGGARGIGLATAQELLRRGARVAIGDIDEDAARKAAVHLGVNCLGMSLDVTNRESFDSFLDRVTAEVGPIDVLVNNAGIMPLGPIENEADALTRRIVDVNLHGPILGTKLAIARMRPRGRGHVVNVSSGVGRVGLAGAATYSATKFGIVGFSEATRSELQGSGIAVSCVLPMIVNTELGAGLSTVKGQKTVEAVDVARAIVATLVKPQFETWVPRTAGWLFRVMSMLPRGSSDALSRRVGASNVLATADVSARAEYEAKVHKTTA
jgi:NAD(P)-dependent dehydrogenase (short-subunit alcohol dehydrogenase family)